MARETSTATLLLLLALTFQSPAWAQTCNEECPKPAVAEDTVFPRLKGETILGLRDCELAARRSDVAAFGPAVLRLAVGAIFIAHGAQKLFGLWGGGGPNGTAAFFAQLGLTPAFPLAIFVGLVELFGGLLLLFAFLDEVLDGKLAGRHNKKGDNVSYRIWQVARVRGSKERQIVEKPPIFLPFLAMGISLLCVQFSPLHA